MSETDNKAVNQDKTSTMGWWIRVFNAIAVGSLAAFSLEKIFIIAGLGGTIAAWPIAVMIASGLLIAVITYTIYPKDAWKKICASLAAAWSQHGYGTADSANIKNTDKKNSSFTVTDFYGHLGGLIKFFMASAGAWLLLSSFGLPVLIFIIPAILVGFAQYFVEATELIPESKALFSWNDHSWLASPKHRWQDLPSYASKWFLVVGHGLGQGLGFFACLAILAPFSPPLAFMLAVGVAAALIIGPSTGRFYGAPFFRWGAELAIGEDNYNIAGVVDALKAKGVSEENANAAINNVKKLASSNNDKDSLSKEQVQKCLHAFGYYLKEDQSISWADLNGSGKSWYAFGAVVGCLGAAFKGALAFAGTAVFCVLIVTGSLALTATPAGWILALASIIGVSTWVVQCSRACPNTGKTFVRKRFGLNGKTVGDSADSEDNPLGATSSSKFAQGTRNGADYTGDLSLEDGLGQTEADTQRLLPASVI